jgi:WXXGXW repeat (2 copies)
MAAPLCPFQSTPARFRINLNVVRRDLGWSFPPGRAKLGPPGKSRDLESAMNHLPRITPWVLFALATALCVTVSAAVAQNQAPPDQGQDPAAVNLAPSGPSYTTQAPPPPGQSAAPGQPDESTYAEQPTETATEPPPQLPDYDQPPPPADGYIWTPGYWAWGPAGYYWVPGAWVEPPYMGALWTPGYWGFYGGRYSFYPGHWGLHIGFYGGINYGFGYVGFGYEGGYWNSGHFFYNRVYNHLNTRVVHNVYSYNASNRARAVSRTSFNGGSHGVQVRPRPSEVSASREPTAPRMSTQEQHARSYATAPGQLAAQNHGRPATRAISRPLPADRNVRATTSHGGQQK